MRFGLVLRSDKRFTKLGVPKKTRDACEGLEVLARLPIGREHADKEMDRLAINRLKIHAFAMNAEDAAYTPQPRHSSVGNGDPAPNARACETLPLCQHLDDL